MTSVAWEGKVSYCQPEYGKRLRRERASFLGIENIDAVKLWAQADAGQKRRSPRYDGGKEVEYVENRVLDGATGNDRARV